MDGGNAENAGAIFSRPPWMVEMLKMQEQFSVDAQDTGNTRAPRRQDDPR
jgi:hypothetical protein